MERARPGYTEKMIGLSEDYNISNVTRTKEELKALIEQRAKKLRINPGDIIQITHHEYGKYQEPSKGLMMVVYYQELTDIRSRDAEIMRILCPDKRDDEDYEESQIQNISPYKMLSSNRRYYYEAKRRGYSNLRRRSLKSKVAASFN